MRFIFIFETDIPFWIGTLFTIDTIMDRYERGREGGRLVFIFVPMDRQRHKTRYTTPTMPHNYSRAVIKPTACIGPPFSIDGVRAAGSDLLAGSVGEKDKGIRR
jgi:hypothetical protein